GARVSSLRTTAVATGGSCSSPTRATTSASSSVSPIPRRRSQRRRGRRGGTWASGLGMTIALRQDRGSCQSTTGPSTVPLDRAAGHDGRHFRRIQVYLAAVPADSTLVCFAVAAPGLESPVG